MFDPILHQPTRTKIVSTIAANEEGVSFKELQSVCEATQGNLNSHLKTLEEAEYVEFQKFFEGRRPKTIYRLSPKGKEAFRKYIETLASFISKQ
jgi:predicted ArsR family transcriptional regulator